MADIEITQAKNAVETVAKKTKKATISPSVKHDKHAPVTVIKSAQNNKNVVTLIALDELGNEKGNEFKVSEREYERSFSNDKKFKFKKKAI